MTAQLLCDGCVLDQAHKPYSLWEGFNAIHRQQLLDFSQSDQEIIANTGDTTRFATAEKMQEWLSGPRLFYILTPKDKPNEMSGLIWFSQEPLPIKTVDKHSKNSRWTFAVRLYKKARGRHLSSPYMKKAFAYFWQKHPREIVWLSTQSTNTIAQKIYAKFGFQPIGRKDDRLYYVIRPE